MDARQAPLVLVMGDDALVEQVCGELTASLRHRVSLLMPAGAEQAIGLPGVSRTTLSTGLDDSLLTAGVAEASALLALADDDELNLAVALRARMLNPRVHIVLRQSNPRLGRKIQQNLAGCSVLSLAAHSAATYAASALSPGCYFAIGFPDEGGALAGFEECPAADLGIGGLAVAEAEQRIGARILALGDRRALPAGTIVNGTDLVTTFGVISARRPSRAFPAGEERGAPAHGRRFTPAGALAAASRANPIVRTLALSALVFFSLSYCYFHFVLGKPSLAAALIVAATMTNAGFTDFSLAQRGPLVTVGAMAAMLGGILFTSVFIGAISSGLTRAQWIAEQGLRRVRARGHVVVCGGGKIGRSVVDALTAAGKRVVVVEARPDPALVRRGRERDVDLLTGDARSGDTLDLCAIPRAAAVLALTNSDAANLEIALGARGFSPDVPLVVRMERQPLAQATAELFGISTFSPAGLSAPAFAGLSQFPGTRGRVRFGGRDHTVVQQRHEEAAAGARPEEGGIPLCVWRDDRLVTIRSFEEARRGEPLLFLSPARA
jgi:voltage-gated potassium channel Kch